MDVTRRRFLNLIRRGLCAGAVLASPVVGAVKKMVPVSRTKAAPLEKYPGGSKPLLHSDVSKTGKWAG